MRLKEIGEILESLNSVSSKIKDIPKEDFSELLKKELSAVGESRIREDVILFVLNLPRNIVMEVEEDKENV